nr:substrate-binding domain-containing protein [Alphaproteobacteria bacterium]
ADYGKLIYDATLNLFRSLENFHSIIGSARGELFGELHFGTVDAMYTNDAFNLPEILKQFSDIAPRVVIHIDTASPQGLLQGLLDERYHAILGPIVRLPSSIRSWFLLNEEQSLFCGDGHPLFPMDDTDITVDALSGHPFAGRSYTQDIELGVDVPFAWGAVSSHMESIALLILSGNFIGYLPTHYANQWVQNGQMRRLLPSQTSYVDRMHLAYRRQERNSAARQFVDCILNSFPHHAT